MKKEVSLLIRILFSSRDSNWQPPEFTSFPENPNTAEISDGRSKGGGIDVTISHWKFLVGFPDKLSYYYDKGATHNDEVCEIVDDLLDRLQQIYHRNYR